MNIKIEIEDNVSNKLSAGYAKASALISELVLFCCNIDRYKNEEEEPVLLKMLFTKNDIIRPKLFEILVQDKLSVLMRIAEAKNNTTYVGFTVSRAGGYALLHFHPGFNTTNGNFSSLAGHAGRDNEFAYP